MPSHAFWYIYATTGRQGFLLDLIARPDSAQARLGLYGTSPPTVIREERPASSLVREVDPLTVRLDALELSPSGCRGRLGKIDMDVSARLSGDSVAFSPGWVRCLAPSVPSLASNYGRIEHGRCQDLEFSDLPFVYSTYEVRRIERSLWILISALQFPGTDLMLEISAVRILSRWAVAAFCRFLGKVYHLTGLRTAFFRSRVTAAGAASGQLRRFHVSCRGGGIGLVVEASAGSEDFVLLEREGNTAIYTTLFGSCRVEIKTTPKGEMHVFEADRTCLLEVKERAA